jgi:hypothetical protein
MAQSGFGSLTGQSLPAERRAPACARDANGKCRPQHLQIRAHVELREPSDVVGIDDVEVCDLVPARRDSIRLARGLDRIEALAHRPIANSVKMDAEPQRIESDGCLGKLSGVDHRWTPICRRRWAVWSQHRGSAILDHSVLHDLDGVRGDTRKGRRQRPSVRQLIDLI